ncbi:energy transducer TonB [Hymenobacter sp. BT770]|uniref:energy transducer TonB n=1 Tax=Hymenobacter sp. BT770 TaxID=2886942 RepID=UPI002670D95A|nr:energy transducer TonB [Hymenobacter sp. BT770]MCC3155009.1 energy transducer TonB [Hymenobacter sp. BT770]MDO3416973.1 energy transducer TonB [Hymenobacter sp. BT770]
MMDNAQIAKASLNDIVFEGRNKAYGAYVLRRLYQRHVTRALIIATAIFSLLIFFPLISQYLKDKMPKEPKKNLQENVLMDAPPLDETKPPPPPPPPEAPPPPPPKLTTIKFTPPVVKKDEEVKKEEVPDQEELKDKTVATVTVKGNTDAPDLTELSGEGDKVVEEVVENKVYTYVEQMPQLPGGGGNAAIVSAIQKATKYPPLALRNQVEGRIFVSFTVNAQGDVSDVKVVKGLGSGLDEETVRAVKTLPKFIPGKQNGRAVSVSFTVPITFKIQ